MNSRPLTRVDSKLDNGEVLQRSAFLTLEKYINVPKKDRAGYDHKIQPHLGLENRKKNYVSHSSSLGCGATTVCETDASPQTLTNTLLRQ